jgi:hypothetical protein
MPATDLFTWLDALWTKARPEGTPPIFIMHRFLAADRDLAPAARYLQLDLKREPTVAFRVWQGLLPKGRGAPRLAYVAPKKGPEAEALTIRMVQVLGERRTVVEEMQAIVTQAGHAEELYWYFGIEPPKDLAVAPDEEEEEEERGSGGLLEGL